MDIEKIIDQIPEDQLIEAEHIIRKRLKNKIPVIIDCYTKTANKPQSLNDFYKIFQEYCKTNKIGIMTQIQFNRLSSELIVKEPEFKNITKSNEIKHNGVDIPIKINNIDLNVNNLSTK